MEDNLNKVEKNVARINRKISSLEEQFLDINLINDKLDHMGLRMADILQYQQKRRSRRREHPSATGLSSQTDETREIKERKDEHEGNE